MRRSHRHGVNTVVFDPRDPLANLHRIFGRNVIWPRPDPMGLTSRESLQRHHETVDSRLDSL